MRKDDIRFVFLWSLAFATLSVALRVGIHAAWAGRVPESIPGVLIGFAGEMAVGSLLAFLGLSRHPILKAVQGISLAILFLVNAAMFHYESVFERLPGTRVLYYFQEMEHVQSSLESHASWFWLLLEASVPTALLLLLQARIQRAVGKRPEGRWAVVFAGLFAAWLVALAVHIFPGMLPQAFFWPSRIPLVYLVQSAALETGNPGGTGKIPEEDLRLFRERLGLPTRDVAADPLYPLCTSRVEEPAAGNGRSLILLILESVGEVELHEGAAGRPVMPELSRIASETVHFSNIRSIGDKSCQAMPAIFAGLVAQPAGNLLWRTPLNALEGFPLALRERGYRTAYFHGSDLGFEQQREFLRMTGFEELHDLDSRDSTPVYGWGYSDRETLKRLRAWIERHRTVDPDTPYLATWFSLGTHDPFLLPPEAERVFSRAEPTFTGPDGWHDARFADSPDHAFQDALRFLDSEVGAFYRWFQTSEQSRGTVLVLVGDHPPQHRLARTDFTAGERFKIPLILAGDGIPEACPASLRGRLGSQTDIAATLRGLVGIEPGRCEQGRNLCDAEAAWPDSRWILSVYGDQLETLVAWTPEGLVWRNRLTGVTNAVGRELASAQRNDRAEQAGEFFDVSLGVSAHLLKTDTFAPQPATLRFDPVPIGPIDTPIRALGGCNTANAIAHAIESGAEWVKVDLQITRDDQLVLMDEPMVLLSDGTRRFIYEIEYAQIRQAPATPDVQTLDEAMARFGDRVGFLVELKPQRIPSMNLAFIREASRKLRERKDGIRILADSVSPFLASAMKLNCDCPVGLDVPDGIPVTEDWLRSVRLSRLDWIFVPAGSVTPDLVSRAHRSGIRVMQKKGGEIPAGGDPPDGWIERNCRVSGS